MLSGDNGRFSATPIDFPAIQNVLSDGDENSVFEVEEMKNCCVVREWLARQARRFEGYVDIVVLCTRG